MKILIVQKHKHLDGSVSYLKFKNGGYNMTVEKYIPTTQDTIVLHSERALRIDQANEWMEIRRKIW